MTRDACLMTTSENQSGAPVRIGFVLPLFSGLEESVVRGDWRPTGVPAIYKLLEAAVVSEKIETLIIFHAKNPELRSRFSKRETVTLPVIGSVTVLAAPRGASRFARLLAEAIYVLQSLFILISSRVDVVYGANGTLFTTSFAAHLLRRPTVLRVMGVFDFHRQLARCRSIGARITRAFFRAPFAQVLVSRDGSGGEDVLVDLIAPGVPIVGRLNGVDPPPSATSPMPNERPYVLFAGRIVSYKGATEFVDAALTILNGHTDLDFDFVVLGEGPERTALEEKVRRAGWAARIRFTGAVSHREVYRWLQGSEIYVSLNRNGALSNINLEALRAGCCLLVARPDHPADAAEIAVIPTTVMFEFSFDTAALVDALRDLMRSPEDRQRLKMDAGRAADRHLTNWSERISWELGELVRLARHDEMDSHRHRDAT